MTTFAHQVLNSGVVPEIGMDHQVVNADEVLDGAVRSEVMASQVADAHAEAMATRTLSEQERRMIGKIAVDLPVW